MSRKIPLSTLFSSDFFVPNGRSSKSESPYPLSLELFCANSDTKGLDDEASIFADVVSHEIAAYEPRGYFYGNLTFEISGGTSRKRSCDAKPVRIPSFVESDCLRFTGCKARALIIVEDETVFRKIATDEIINQLQVILITGCGIPRLSARRLVKRLQTEYGLPVVILADNDTWGYWIYSVLKTGLMAPGESSPFASLKRLRFVGLKAKDCRTFKIPDTQKRPWKSLWTLRLEAMRMSPCFSSRPWQDELTAFEQNHYAVNLRDFVNLLGVRDFAEGYLRSRLARFCP